jgi:lysine-arginine-ornithine-binding protein
MKLKNIFVLLASSLAINAAVHAEEVIRIGTQMDYAPFEFKDASGKLQGMEIDLGDSLCANMKAKCEYVTMDFDALVPALKAKKIDVVLAQLSITAERKKTIDFTDLFTLAPVQYVTKVGAGISENPATLKGKTVGIQSGTNHESYIKERLVKKNAGVKVKVYAQPGQALLDLEAKRIDAYMTDSTAAYDWLSKTGTKKGFALAGKPVEDLEMFGEGTGLAVRKGDALKDRLNVAIKQIVADGTFATINKKYFPFSIAPGGM